MKKTYRFAESKIGQITVFMVIGILLLVTFWIAMYISDRVSTSSTEKARDQSQQLSLESKALKTNIENCVKRTTDEAIYFETSQGLYLTIPEGYKYSNLTASWINQTIVAMPINLSSIERDLEKYVDRNLASCVGLDEFRVRGWTVNKFQTNTTIKLLNESVYADVNITTDITKETFRLEISEYNYNSPIRLKRMYEKSIDLINTQLLSPAFDVETPLASYDLKEFTVDTQKLDNMTIMFSIGDKKSKLANTKPVRLKFIGNFDTNRATRIYDLDSCELGTAEIRILFSPDRRGTLLFMPGTKSTSDKIIITQYTTPNVTQKDTPKRRVNNKTIEFEDITLITNYPIYQFQPVGTNFTNPVFLNIRIKGQDMPNRSGMLHHGRYGWLPYPHTVNNETKDFTTMIYGFSSYTPIDGSNQTEQDYSASAEEDKTFWETWGQTIIIAIAAIIAIVLTLVTFGVGGFVVGGLYSLFSLGMGMAYSGYLLLAEIVILGLYANGLGGFADVEKSVAFSAIVDDQIKITTDEKGDISSKCTITQIDNQQVTEVNNGGTFSAKAGKAYQMTATITDFDWGEDSGTCNCTVQGLIVSIGTNNTEEENMTTNQTLVCCKTVDGYCVDNYKSDICAEYGGVGYEKICTEVTECQVANATNATLTGNGYLFLDPSSGKKGTSFTVVYFVADKVGADVTATIKVDGTKMDEIKLYDDGAHGDGRAGNYYYGNTWSSSNVEMKSSTSIVTVDIKVSNGASEVTKESAGTAQLTARSADCQTLGGWNSNAGYNIAFVENNYGAVNNYQGDVTLAMGKFQMLTPVQSYMSTNGLNYFRIDKDFETSSIGDIKYYAGTACSASPIMYVILDKTASGCASYGNYYVVPPTFAFNSLANKAESAETLFGMLCSFVQ